VACFAVIPNILDTYLVIRSATPMTCCQTNLQQLWRQVFCRCKYEAVEQPSTDLQQADINFQRF